MVRSLVLALVLAACTGSTEPAPVDSGEVALIGEGIAWEDKTVEEKFSWMTFRVVPEMRPRFEAFDPSYVDNFSCSTCHGTETSSSGYGAMPHATGPAELSMSDWPSNSSDTELRAYAAFMEDEVEPAMAALLGTAVATQSTPDGITCGTCHRIGN